MQIFRTGRFGWELVNGKNGHEKDIFTIEKKIRENLKWEIIFFYPRISEFAIILDNVTYSEYLFKQGRYDYASTLMFVSIRLFVSIPKSCFETKLVFQYVTFFERLWMERFFNFVSLHV